MVYSRSQRVMISTNILAPPLDISKSNSFDIIVNLNVIMNQRDCVAQLPEHWTSVPMVIDSIAQCRYGLRVNRSQTPCPFFCLNLADKQSVCVCGGGGGWEARMV